MCADISVELTPVQQHQYHDQCNVNYLDHRYLHCRFNNEQMIVNNRVFKAKMLQSGVYVAYRPSKYTYTTEGIYLR